VLVSVLFYFCLYSGYSGTVPLDSIVFSGYNFYLGLPIIALVSESVRCWVATACACAAGHFAAEMFPLRKFNLFVGGI
jgi:hypothetical protein